MTLGEAGRGEVMPGLVRFSKVWFGFLGQRIFMWLGLVGYGTARRGGARPGEVGLGLDFLGQNILSGQVR